MNSVKIKLPRDATDCHMHVFGPLARYPLASTRRYTPRAASFAQYRMMAAAVGLERVIIVQPSPYGADNRCLLDTLRDAGPQARGVAVIGADTTDAELDLMHEAGVRGVRLNAESFSFGDPQVIGATLRNLADRVRRLGWHIQVFASLHTIASLAPVIESLEVFIVIDHMGLAQADRGVRDPDFLALLSLVKSGVWIKLSAAYRVSSGEMNYADIAPIASSLIAANPQRVLWGSDWPHTGKHGGENSDPNAPLDYRRIDNAGMLRLLAAWTVTSAQFDNILVDNPSTLYGF
jgi:predicted TIM-barrel fold metal-dependent hydrolase